MKKILLAVCLSVGIMYSCSDKCKDVSCLNGGTCDEGKCKCVQGYEGERCATASRDRFIGTWSGEYTIKVTAEGETSPFEQTFPDSVIFKAGKGATLEMVGYESTNLIPSGNSLQMTITYAGTFFQLNVSDVNMTVNGKILSYKDAKVSGKMDGKNISGTVVGIYTKK